MMNLKSILLALGLGTMMAASTFAQGTAFTYQGQLDAGGAPANGSYDISFTLYTNSSGGSAIAGPVTNLAVGVTNGLFTTIVDFPNVFSGASNWLALAVRTNGAASFSPPLTPWQQLTPTPYAVYAETANAAGLTGTISGNGSGLTNVNATNLTGTVAATHLPANVALLGANQTFTGINDFSASVGLGTTSPLATLEIRDAGGRNLVMSGPGGAEWSFYDSTANAYYWDISGGSGNFAISDSGIGYPFSISRPSGNVGIGTTTPANTLEVQGSADFTGSVGIGTNAPVAQFHVVASQYGSQPVAIFDVDNCGGPCAQGPYQENIRLVNLNPNGQTGLSFLTSTNSGDNLTNVPAAWIGTGYTSFNDNSLIFASQAAGALVDRMYLQGNTGFLGIGTDSPANMLDVQGSADFSGHVGIGTNSPNWPLTVNSRTYGIVHAYGGVQLGTYIDPTDDNGVQAQLGTISPHNLGFAVNNQEPTMTINTNGSVGIGTYTPNSDSQLQVIGKVRMGSENGTSQAPNRSILVRRINSSSTATGQVVARCVSDGGNVMTLERDGTAGGLVLKIAGTVSSGSPQISGYGINASAAFVGVHMLFYTGGSYPSTQIFTDAQKIAYLRLSFGEPLNDADMTTVELTRYVDNSGNDNFTWIGTVTSTVNQ
jgi:hypothetical protein